MKFVQYKHRNVLHCGILAGNGQNIIPIDNLLPGKPREMAALIQALSEKDIENLSRLCRLDIPFLPLETVELCAPIIHPRQGVLCVGVNYFAHRQETERNFGAAQSQQQAETVYFAKRTNGILGHGAAINCRFNLDTQVDYEVELAIIMGKTASRVKAQHAEEYIFGYSVFNDWSSRGLQQKHQQWFRGKSLDGYASMGPCILHKSAVPLAQMGLTLCTYVNGEERQRANTGQMMKGIAEIIAEISDGITLYAGDIIATGTPAGVGMGFSPPKYLKAGDIVRCEISEIGVLENKIAASETP